MVTAQVVGYIDVRWKQRMDQLKQCDRRMTISKILEECVERALPEIEAAMKEKCKPDPSNPGHS